MAEVKDLEQATPVTEPAAAAEAAPKGGWAAKWKDMPKKKRRRLIRAGDCDRCCGGRMVVFPAG